MSLRDTSVYSLFPWFILYIPTFSTSFNPVLNKRVDPWSRQPKDVICGMLPPLDACIGRCTDRFATPLRGERVDPLASRRHSSPETTTLIAVCVSGRDADASTSVRVCLSTLAVARFAPRSASNRARFTRVYPCSRRAREMEISPWSSAEEPRRAGKRRGSARFERWSRTQTNVHTRRARVCIHTCTRGFMHMHMHEHEGIR